MKLLSVLKPDGVIRKAAGAGILNGLSNSTLCEFLSFKKVMAPTELLAEHYHHVSQRGFYPWLIRYISSYPCYVILLEAKPENIEKLRDLLGATRSHLAAPSSLRNQFCPFGGANGLHLSEDENAGKIETALWEKTLGVKAGQFDVPINEYIQKYLNGPNRTNELRAIFLEIAARRTVLDDHMKEIKALLREECVGAPQEEVDFLSWALTARLLFTD
jgi:nucleoside diphosphate kinase